MAINPTIRNARRNFDADAAAFMCINYTTGRTAILARLLKCQTPLSSLSMIRNPEPVCFVVREQNILFVRLDCARVPDEAFGLVELVLHDPNYRNDNAGILEHALCRADLRLAAVNGKHSRQRPLGVIQAAR